MSQSNFALQGLHGAAFLEPINISLSPWTNFNKLWTLTMGYPADDFKFVAGKTPMSTITETVGITAAYLAIVFGGRELMRNRQPLKLNGLFMAHNFVLTIISGALLVLFAEQLIPSLWAGGLYENICGASGWTEPLVVFYYVSWLPYERQSGLTLSSWTTSWNTWSCLIPCFWWWRRSLSVSTGQLSMRRKCAHQFSAFLHCYHHPATALLCYTQLIGSTSVSWVPITLNLTVHVVMYWYYFQSARGIRVSWKEWITRLQIAQFVIDLGMWKCSFLTDHNWQTTRIRLLCVLGLFH